LISTWGLNIERDRASPGSIPVLGMFKDYNTVEEFQAADKTALFNQGAKEVCDALLL